MRSCIRCRRVCAIDAFKLNSGATSRAVPQCKQVRQHRAMPTIFHWVTQQCFIPCCKVSSHLGLAAHEYCIASQLKIPQLEFVGHFGAVEGMEALG